MVFLFLTDTLVQPVQSV